MFPGKPGRSHRHVFFGNRSTNAASMLASLKQAGSTCDDPADRASYWLPGLVGGSWFSMRAYYIAGGLASSMIQPFPSGLQAVAGWKFDPHGGAVTWSCGLMADQAGWTASRPMSCRTGARMAVRIDFPQCWDGAHLSAPGNLARPRNGACPVGFPVAVPMLRIRADIIGTATALTSGPFDTMHADFWNVWEPQRLHQLVKTCIRGERVMQHDVRRCGVPGAGPRSPSTV
jgi:Domain of unknown function (DUF1996)